MRTAPGATSACSAFQFHVNADNDPQILLRMIGIFARLSLMPTSLNACSIRDEIVVAIEQPGLAASQAALLAERLRNCIGVKSVDLTAWGESASPR